MVGISLIPLIRSPVISGTNNPGTGPAPIAKDSTYARVPNRAIGPEIEERDELVRPRDISNMDSPMPVKLNFRRYFLPALSIKEAAPIVPNTFIKPTAALARASEASPALANTEDEK